MSLFIVVLINGTFRFFIMLPVKFIQSTVLHIIDDQVLFPRQQLFEC